MFQDELKQQILALFSDYTIMEEVQSVEGWVELGERTAALTESLTALAEFSLSDATSRAAELFRQLAASKINHTGEALNHIRSLLATVNEAAEAGDYDQGALKEAVASADAYLQDISSAEEPPQQDVPEIDAEFINELEGRIDRLEQLLFDTHDGERNPEIVKSIFREYHTLKGEAGILGLKKLSEFWHAVEEPIEQARHGSLTITSHILDALLELTKFGRNLLRNGALSAQEKTAVETQQKNLLRAVGKDPSVSVAPVAQVAPIDLRGGAARPPAPAIAPAVKPAAPVAAAKPPVEPAPAAAVAEDDDDFFGAALRAEAAAAEPPAAPALNVDAAEEPAPAAPAIARSAAVASASAPAPVAAPAPAAVKPAPAAPAPERAQPQTPAEAETALPIQNEQSLRWVQIEVSRLDQLLDMVGEVAMVGAHLSRAGHSADARTAVDLQDLQRLCRSLHDMAASLRMIAIAPLFQRVQRAALDAARAVNKRVEFQISGEDTKVDRSVIDKISAALVHLARNSVDHGLESQEARRDLGKSAQGLLTLSAKRLGADVLIEFSDDGRGLDIDKIVAKARKLGLVGQEEKLTPEQGAALIFSQGLSTAESVTGLSGRGVGMAVVKESAEALRGRVDILNRPGQGVTFSIRFPVALAAVETLLVRLGANILALPVQSVRETFRVAKDQISSVEGRGQIVNLRGVVVPLINLSGSLGLAGSNAGSTADEGVLVLVEEGEKLAAVVVDEVLETRQVVIRPLEGQLQAIADITGAALLNDRQVALVLDIRRMLEQTHISAGATFSAASQRQASADRQVETVSVGSNSVGLIDFCLRARGRDGQVKPHVFAINAFKTREFVPVSPLTPVPDMPDGFAGMLLLRNETIPVMALDTLLGFSKPGERTGEFDEIIIICEFSGVTVGFLVSEVNSVSYVTWDDIHQPPETGSAFSINYVIGTIQIRRLRESAAKNDDSIAFLLDFERIVQQVLDLYGDIGAELNNVQLRKEHNRILLVEDSPLIRRETAATLRKAGMEVLEASNGKEAISMIDRLYAKAREEKRSIFNYLDLILSDIEMPVLDGYSLTRHVKSHPDLRLLPTLLHSSLTNETIVRRAKEVHADGFIPKCDPHKLAEHLRRYL